MVEQEKGLSDLRHGMTKMPQKMINVRLPDKRDVMGHPSVQGAVRDVESKLSGRGRVLLRPSGTEPLIRVMVEGDDAEEVALLCQHLAKSVEAVISA
jgi:phosphoglucosamine mutase